MQAKHLIMIAILGILGLVIFNWSMSAKTQHAIEANQQASQPTADAAPPAPANNGTIGNQPKATLDKANAQIDQANAETANKMAEAEKATQ